MDKSMLPPLLSAASDPLSLFVRVGRQDHHVVGQWLSERRTGLSGLIFDPCCEDAHENARKAAEQRGLWTILDPKGLELATLGGATTERLALPWAGDSVHTPGAFDSDTIDAFASKLAAFVAKHGYTAVLAPTHYLSDGATDRWLQIDRELTRKLRAHLDALRLSRVQIFYPLAVPMVVFRNSSHVSKFADVLRDLPVSAVWLRISPFGSDSGHVSLENYINACRLLQSTALPIVAEKVGAIGLALLAFGAVTGMEVGAATGEKFDIQRFRHRSKSGHFAMPARVYIPRLNLFLKRNQAARFFAVRGMKEFACLEETCCRRGVDDMLEHNKRHFLNARSSEVALLSAAPLPVRPTQYLDEILRPATDQLGRIARYSGIPEDVMKKLMREKRKLDGWRATLGTAKRFHVHVAEPTPLQRQISIFPGTTPAIPGSVITSV